MRSVRVEALSSDAFRPFGFFARMIDPEAERIGAPPIEFYRDILQQGLGGHAAASFSTCRVEPREPVIDVSEFHSATAEAILPLDNDILIHVAPATAIGSKPPLDDVRVFRVARGTLVVLRPGVWHHAPFSADTAPANVLIVLPERTYANDCTVHRLDDSERIGIAG